MPPYWPITTSKPKPKQIAVSLTWQQWVQVENLIRWYSRERTTTEIAEQDNLLADEIQRQVQDGARGFSAEDFGDETV